MKSLTNYLTNYRHFSLFLIISGIAYFLILYTGYDRLARNLLAGFLALLLIDFVVFIIAAIIHETDEKNPLIVSLGGISLFYLICLILQSGALRIWLTRHKNFTDPYLLLDVFIWLCFYSVGLLVIRQIKKDRRKEQTQTTGPEN